MATIGNSQFIKPIIDDTTQSTQTTYSSDKINDLMKQFGAEDIVYLLTVSKTAPASFTTGDKYYDENKLMVFEAVDNTSWNTGSTPSKFTLYVDLAHNRIYVYHNNKFVAVSGSVTISKEPKNAIEDKSDGMYVEDLSEEVKRINIAQKTVNELGYEDLLSSKPTFDAPFNNSASIINKTIELEKPITDYEFIELYISAASYNSMRGAQVTRLKVSDIVFNSTNTEKQDLSIFSVCHSLNGNTSMGGDNTMVAKMWFKDATHLYIHSTCNPQNSSWKTYRFDHILGISKEIVTIDPMNYVNETQGIEDTPVGHIMSIMATKAPKHYLICDGTEYNIDDYRYLAQHFKEEFGKINYFGGDGVTTFAVPDLRNEFLRGYGNLSAEIGEHQDPTEVANTIVYGNAMYMYKGLPGSAEQAVYANIDSIAKVGTYGLVKTTGTQDTMNRPTATSTYTTRPTNTAVLYVIKYEPTYFTNVIGTTVENTLFSTPTILALNTEIKLNDDYTNYDKIRFEWIHNNKSVGDIYPQYLELEKKDLIINNTGVVGPGSIAIKSICLGYPNTFSATILNITDKKTLKVQSNNIAGSGWGGNKLLRVVGITINTKLDNGIIGGPGSCDCEDPTETDITAAINASITELNK